MHSELGVPVAIPPESVSSQGALSNWLLSWFAGASDDERAVMVQGVYGLWLARNNAHEGKKIEEASEIALTVGRLMEEWQAVHGRKSKVPKAVPVEKWKPPDEGWVKVNVDGATSKWGDNGGAGVVFRNQEGAFLGGACHSFPGCQEPAEIELQARRRAVQLADEVNATSLHIEMDCQEIVRKLQSKAPDMSPLGPMIQEVKSMLETRQRWKVSWIRRTANTAAHGLAKEGVLNNLCKVWLHEPPECILHIISAEIPAFYE